MLSHRTLKDINLRSVGQFLIRIRINNFNQFNFSQNFKQFPRQQQNIIQGRTMTNSNGSLEICKANAAKLAVDKNIDRDCIVGIGSGSTIPFVVERIKQRCQEKKLSIKCIPTSFQAKQLIYDFELPLTDLDAHPAIDVTIDGADELDENFVAIKGGGACLAREKVIAAASKKFVVVADYRKDSKYLGQGWTKGIPLEVLPMAYNFVRHQIAREFKVKTGHLVLRIGREKAGPVVTDNGNFVLDWKFEQERYYSSSDWKALSDRVKLIPGVVETGIFAKMVHEAYFGQQDGTVKELKANI